MTDPVRVGVVGLGYWGPNLARNFDRLPGAELHWICDRSGEARERGFDEALLVTPHGHVLEAPTSSIFYLAGDGALYTPPLDEHILASITRDLVLRLADAQERAVTADEFVDVPEAFLVSTTREVQPVSAIESRELTAPGERTRAAAAAIRSHIQAALGAD